MIRLAVFGPVSAAAALLGIGCETGSLQKVEQGESILAIFSGPTPAEAVAAMVDPDDPDRRLRGTAMVAYAPFGGEQMYVTYYVNQIQHDEDAGVRAVAARALSLHGSPEHAPLIVPLLENPDRNVRLEAARALQRIHNPVAIEALVKRTQPERFIDATRMDLVGTRVGEPEALVRAECCTALGQYAEPKVLQALIRALDDDHLVVTRAARDSLAVLTGKSFGEDQRAWLTWLAETKEPFAGRGEYLYPAFSRPKTWIEYVPLVPSPPNETPAPPVGLGSVNAK